MSSPISKYTPPKISQADQTALNSDSVKTAVSKLKTDLKNNASQDVIQQDKTDAFAKYQAAGGQASSAQAFGEEVSHHAGGDAKALREAFGLPDTAHRGGGKHTGGAGGSSASGSAPADSSSSTTAGTGSSSTTAATDGSTIDTSSGA